MLNTLWDETRMGFDYRTQWIIHFEWWKSIRTHSHRPKKKLFRAIIAISRAARSSFQLIFIHAMRGRMRKKMRSEKIKAKETARTAPRVQLIFLVSFFFGEDGGKPRRGIYERREKSDWNFKRCLFDGVVCVMLPIFTIPFRLSTRWRVSLEEDLIDRS